MTNLVTDSLVVTGADFAQAPAGSLLVTPAGSTGALPLAQLLGAFPGNKWFVNETTGLDTNVGSGAQPFKTISAALNAATAGQNDAIYLTGTVHLTAPLAWNKANVHLIGLCAPQRTGKRARISTSGATPFSYLVDVSVSNCLFSNFGTFYGFPTTGATTPICWHDSAGRNCYDNVEFLGFGDNTVSTGTANQTGARAFQLNTSTGETTWQNCTFGADTLQRNATNYTLEVAGGAPRCVLQNCDFVSALGSSGTSSSHLLVGSAGIDRTLKFNQCRFTNDTLSSGSTMTQILNVSGSAGGVVLLDRCTGFGGTHWETSASGSVYLNMTAATAHDGGLAVAASPS